ncbi:MAG TPA: UbiD family decarboxylase domain-containing protein, partial [Dehalococcoidia bacterium]|nr:UbiD family decarboxylase domain-containing protein [Dehalococcoidia bacterium]
PIGVSEYDYVGAIRGEPVKVIKGPITGLPIPATAEIVIEGFVDPGVEGPEGPHGEFMGYYASGARTAPTLRVEGLYYRNAPILMGAPPLRPVDYAGAYYGEILRSCLLWDGLEAAGVPDVAGAWSYVARSLMMAVAIRQRYPGHAKQAGRIAALTNVGRGLGRYVVVVDEDIDVTDIDEVLWAMCTRVDPDRDIEVLRECPSAALDPMVHPDRKKNPTMPRVVIDATRPYEWRDRFPEVVASSPELRQQVLARWGELLKGIV